MIFRRYNFLEMILVVGIISLILGLFARSFFGDQGELQNKAAVRAFEQGIERMQWISASEQVQTGLCPTKDGTRCHTDWSIGWLVFVDSNQNGQLDPDERVSLTETERLPEKINTDTSLLLMTKTGRLTTISHFEFLSDGRAVSVEVNRAARVSAQTTD